MRPLSAAELSDGTLRYLLLVAALLTPRPPTLMVLNEPETSLHPDLLPALARLIIRASGQCQVWVVSHARRLISALQEDPECNCIVLEKNWARPGLSGSGCWMSRRGIGRIEVSHLVTNRLARRAALPQLTELSPSDAV